MKDVQAKAEVFIPERRASNTSKTLIFFTSVRYYRPPVRIRIQPTVMNADPDPQHSKKDDKKREGKRHKIHTTLKRPPSRQ